jgi:hypothetical protein
MSKSVSLPLLFMSPDDPPYRGKVVSFSTRENDIVGKQWVLILETLGQWGGFQSGRQVQFQAPDEGFWARACGLGRVEISRFVPEGAKLARYKVDPVGTIAPQPQQENTVAGKLNDQQTSAIWMAALVKSAKMVAYMNAQFLSDELKMSGAQVASIGMSLVIAHQRGEIQLTPYNPDA